MVAPLITDFGDEDHEFGETGLTVTGFDFFPGVGVQGTLHIFENADRTGATDALTIGTHGNNSIPDVEIPASPNNVAGTVYLAFHRGGDMAWSNSYEFTLTEAAVASAEVAATLAESTVIAGGGEITITLTNDTWVASGATFNAQRQNILDGISGTSFDAVIADQAVTAVARTSDTLVTITLGAFAAYAIGADETVTCIVPATALTGGVELDAGSFVVDDDVALLATTEEDVTGAGAFNYYSSYRQRQQRRERDREAALEAIREIDDKVDREIAELIQKQEKISDERQQLEELQAVVEKAGPELAELGGQVEKAYERAAAQGNYSALMAFQREVDQALEQEEFLLLTVAMLE